MALLAKEDPSKEFPSKKYPSKEYRSEKHPIFPLRDILLRSIYLNSIPLGHIRSNAPPCGNNYFAREQKNLLKDILLRRKFLTGSLELVSLQCYPVKKIS